MGSYSVICAKGSNAVKNLNLDTSLNYRNIHVVASPILVLPESKKFYFGDIRSDNNERLEELNYVFI